MKIEEVRLIYLDNAGTTRMFDECVEVHREFSCEKFFNPSALSAGSLDAGKCIGAAEGVIMRKIGAREGNVLFTGCATESNNLAICGSVRTGDWEYVFSAGEHPSVFETAKKLERDGHKVIFVGLDEHGCVNLSELERVLSKKTRLISIMHVSNETGAINDLQKISKLKDRLCPKAIFHVDGVQGFMKIPTDLSKTSVDLYSFSAHKIHGPKGVAGLWVKNKSGLKSLFQGGGQQFGLRSGTENVSGIMQLKKAVEMIDVSKNFEHVKKLRALLIQNLDGSGVVVRDFGGSPYILNLIFPTVKGETMLHALESEGVIVGLGSACSSKKEGNRILSEIGLQKDEIVSSVRVSFNAYMSEEEVALAAKIIKNTYQQIKEKVN